MSNMSTLVVTDITSLYKYLWSKPMTKQQIIKLHLLSVGYCNALRDAGLRPGDGRYNDASNAQMEIRRYGFEALGMKESHFDVVEYLKE